MTTQLVTIIGRNGNYFALPLEDMLHTDPLKGVDDLPDTGHQTPDQAIKTANQQHQLRQKIADQARQAAHACWETSRAAHNARTAQLIENKLKETK